MPCLSNARHERFAQALAAGKTIDQAYRAAGYAGHRGNASTLRSKQHIRARVAELLSNAAEGAVLTKQWILDGLIEVVERGLQPKAVFRKGKLVASGSIRRLSSARSNYSAGKSACFPVALRRIRTSA